MKKELKLTSIKKYFNSLFYRTITSLFLLMFLFCTYKTKLINDNFNLKNNIIMLKVPYLLTKILPNDYQINDVEVFDKIEYDYVEFDGLKNTITNYSFDGVYNIVDGIIIKIVKNNMGSYNVTIQDVNGFCYEYCNLKSVDFSIYSFVKSQTILGTSQYNKVKKCYQYDLYINKKGEFYDIYKMATS